MEGATTTAEDAEGGQTAPGAVADAAPAHVPETDAAGTHNFFVLAAYQVVMRVGWIFKTESIIMPAALDALGGQAWLRAILPLLNRFGQSVPPAWYASFLQRLPIKKVSLTTTTSIMAGAFLMLAAVVGFLPGSSFAVWAPALFLVCYGLFFGATGLNALAFGTLQGKLVPAKQRGRLMLVANFVGAAAAIGCAWWLMRDWLAGDAGFHLLFAFAGGGFLLAAVVAWQLDEPADEAAQAAPSMNLWQRFRDVFIVLRDDGEFRWLAVTASLFGASMMLFPHYQNLGLHGADDLQRLVVWVIVQNFGTALFSFGAGPLADWQGNRAALRWVLGGLALAPPAALLLAASDGWRENYFFIVFLLVGLTPVAIRTLSNYTLEMSRLEDHPRYLTVLSVSIAAPVMLSPLAGLVIDLIGTPTPIFIVVEVCLLVGWLLTFRLIEPRTARAGL